MTVRRLAPCLAAVAIAVLVGACGTSASPTPSPPPAPTPTPVPSPLTVAELKYRIIDQLGRPSFCDRDFYPVGRDELAAARERFDEMRADEQAFLAIVFRLGLAELSHFSDAELLAIYRDYKMLGAAGLAPDPADPARYRFEIRIVGPQGAEHELRVDGSITADGTIEVGRETDVGPLICPICLARGALIDTPSGPTPVEELRPGMVVWTVDEHGVRVARRVERWGSTPVGFSHRVVHLVLDDGREMRASPGHPLADGRRLGDLAPGDIVDGARVVAAELVAYDGGATFDLLPSGPTGIYFAGGIPLASTLRP